MSSSTALNRRRTLSVRLAALQRADAEELIRAGDSAMPAVLLEELSGQVSQKHALRPVPPATASQWSIAGLARSFPAR